MFPEGERDGPGEDENDSGAYCGGEIRIDVRDADFGQQSCGGSEER